MLTIEQIIRELDPSKPLIEVRGLRVRFGDREILRGVDLDLHRRETVIILGGSGCGKSTLLGSIIGTVTPYAGDVRIFGRSVMGMPEAERDVLRRKIGILFQSGALFNSMSCAENLAFVLREHSVLTEEEIEILVRMKLEMVGLRHAEELLPSEISGGMKKRVGMARALCLDPLVMLYDEPGAGLDPVTLAGIDRSITSLKRVLGMGSLVVTHEINSALRIADRMIFLHHGQVLADGPPEEITNHPDARIRQFLEGQAEGPLTDESEGDDYAESLLGKEFSW